MAGGQEQRGTYHWFNIRMWHSFKLVEIQLQVGPKVDVRALIFGAVTVSRCGKHWMLGVKSQRVVHDLHTSTSTEVKRTMEDVYIPVMQRPSCSTSYPSILTS